MVYDEEHRAVLAYRKARDGKMHRLDNSPFLVYGDDGILLLCELWGVDNGQGDIRWPKSEVEWAVH